MFYFVLTAYASADSAIRSINKAIVNPLIILMFAIATVYFIYGLFEFLKDSDNAEAREKGKQHILWGLIGMLVMVMVFFIMKIILGTLGIEGQINPEELEVNLPPIVE